jgi:hypothetical protein
MPPCTNESCAIATMRGRAIGCGQRCLGSLGRRKNGPVPWRKAPRRQPRSRAYRPLGLSFGPAQLGSRRRLPRRGFHARRPLLERRSLWPLGALGRCWRGSTRHPSAEVSRSSGVHGGPRPSRSEPVPMAQCIRPSLPPRGDAQCRQLMSFVLPARCFIALAVRVATGSGGGAGDGHRPVERL